MYYRELLTVFRPNMPEAMIQAGGLRWISLPESPFTDLERFRDGDVFLDEDNCPWVFEENAFEWVCISGTMPEVSDIQSWGRESESLPFEERREILTNGLRGRFWGADVMSRFSYRNISREMFPVEDVPEGNGMPVYGRK